jgi:hypothetical protein
LALLRDIQKEFDQEEAFAYRFLDDTLEAQYASEKRLTVMLTTFTILAIHYFLARAFRADYLHHRASN